MATPATPQAQEAASNGSDPAASSGARGEDGLGRALGMVGDVRLEARWVPGAQGLEARWARGRDDEAERSARSARGVAEAALQSRDEFLAVLSHELRSPATTVRGLAQVALRELRKTDGGDLDRVRRALEMLDQQSDRFVRLATQLLDASRVEAGQVALDRQPSDLAALIKRVVAERAMTTALAGHSVVVEAPPAAVAWVDPLRIEQVVTNLLDNALKYSPDGGEIKIGVSVPSPESVRVVVRDRGVGIPPEHLPHIFDRFYRGHTGGRAGGLGIGLYVSRQIVELHGGRIEAACPETGGTCLTVTLPTGQAALAHSPVLGGQQYSP